MASNPQPPHLRQALQILSDEARRQVAAHPWGHLLAGRRELLTLHLELPLDPRDLDAATLQAAEALGEAVQALLVHRTTFRPGRVFCLRCRSADCEHSAPADHRQVFTGYGATGLPRFQDLGQWLLQRHDPRVDELYQTPPRLLTVVSSGAELTAELLPAYQDPERGFQLHGQVIAGWYSVADRDGHPQPLAVTLQVVSSMPPGQSRRFGLNVLARGPAGESLEAVYDRLGEIPWAAAVRWGQTVLGQIEGTKDKAIPEGVTILRIQGPFLFGSTEKLTDSLVEVRGFGPIVILRLRNMTAIDATGLRAIQDFADALPQPARMMAQSEFHRHVGVENIVPNVDAAIARAEALLRERERFTAGAPNA